MGSATKAGSSARVRCAAVARILIVGGGCRGRLLASEMTADGHVVRVTTRTESSRGQIEETGAQCWIGTPDRLATLGGALDSVTIACWLLGTATGTPGQLSALHGSRLDSFVAMAIDTTVRGLVYESCGTITRRAALKAGERIVRDRAERNAIPVSFLKTDPRDTRAWLADARAAVDSLLGRR
jgi:hypothetical protein